MILPTTTGTTEKVTCITRAANQSEELCKRHPELPAESEHPAATTAINSTAGTSKRCVAAKASRLHRETEDSFAGEEDSDPKVNWIRGTSIEIQVGRRKRRLKFQWDSFLGPYVDLDGTRRYFAYYLNHRIGHEELHLTDMPAIM